MNKLVFILFSIFIIADISAQQDPEAKKILDQFAVKIKSFTVYKADFSINTENLQNKEVTIKKGSITIKGDKYFMILGETEIYCDGKSIWNYLEKSNEVSINKVLKNKKSDDLDNPAKLFNLYTTDFKFQYLGVKTEKGRQCYEVDLYPFDINKSYSIVRLHIDKANLELVSAKIFQKSGIHATVSIDTFTGNFPFTDKDFVFDPKKHPNVEVTDLR